MNDELNLGEKVLLLTELSTDDPTLKFLTDFDGFINAALFGEELESFQHHWRGVRHFRAPSQIGQLARFQEVWIFQALRSEERDKNLRHSYDSLPILMRDELVTTC